MRDPSLAPTESDLEIAWTRLARKGGFPPHRSQFKVMDGDRYLGRMDFAYEYAKVAIEVDGWRWHFGKQAWDKGRLKSNYLQSLGWVILRFDWDEVTRRSEKVIQLVRATFRPRLQLPL